MSTASADVVVVGAGPVGLVAGCLGPTTGGRVVVRPDGYIGTVGYFARIAS